MPYPIKSSIILDKNVKIMSYGTSGLIGSIQFDVNRWIYSTNNGTVWYEFVSKDYVNATVQASTSGLVSVSLVADKASLSYVNATVQASTSGLASVAFVNSMIAGIGGVTASYVNATVQASTSGLASVAFVNNMLLDKATQNYVNLTVQASTSGLANYIRIDGQSPETTEMIKMGDNWGLAWGPDLNVYIQGYSQVDQSLLLTASSSGATAQENYISISGVSGVDVYGKNVSMGNGQSAFIALGSTPNNLSLVMNGYYANLDNNSLSADRNYSFPNKNGTFALISDVQASTAGLAGYATQSYVNTTVRASTSGLASVAFVNSMIAGIGGVTASYVNATVQASTSGLASVAFVSSVIADKATFSYVNSTIQSSTSGLASVDFVNSVIYDKATQAYVNTTVQSSTSGLASVAFVSSILLDKATQAYVNATVQASTSGLASVAFVNNMVVDKTTFSYVNSTIQSSTSGLATVAFVNSMLTNRATQAYVNTTVQASTTGLATVSYVNSTVQSSTTGLASVAFVNSMLADKATQAYVNATIQSSTSGLASVAFVSSILLDKATQAYVNATVQSSTSGLASVNFVNNMVADKATQTYVNTTVQSSTSGLASVAFVNNMLLDKATQTYVNTTVQASTSGVGIRYYFHPVTGQLFRIGSTVSLTHDITANTIGAISNSGSVITLGAGVFLQSNNGVVSINSVTNVTATTVSNNSTSGALIVAGGIGVGGNISLSGYINLGSLPSDPSAGTNGSFYYNTTSRKIRACENGSWINMIGVDGPGSATDKAVVRFDGITGKLIQNSGVIIDDLNNVTGIVDLTASNIRRSGNLMITLTNVGSVNYFTLSNASTSGAPKISATGSDVNINLAFESKGTSGYVQMTNNTALMIPKGTTVQRPVPGATAMIRYNNDYNYVEVFNASTAGSSPWERFVTRRNDNVIFSWKGSIASQDYLAIYGCGMRSGSNSGWGGLLIQPTVVPFNSRIVRASGSVRRINMNQAPGSNKPRIKFSIYKNGFDNSGTFVGDFYLNMSTTVGNFSGIQSVNAANMVSDISGSNLVVAEGDVLSVRFEGEFNTTAAQAIEDAILQLCFEEIY